MSILVSDFLLDLAEELYDLIRSHADAVVALSKLSTVRLIIVHVALCSLVLEESKTDLGVIQEHLPSIVVDPLFGATGFLQDLDCAFARLFGLDALPRVKSRLEVASVLLE